MTNKNILFYYPSNKRTIPIETLLIELKRKGHTVTILTTCSKGDFHYYMESIGFETYSNELGIKGIKYYVKQILYLISFCRIKNIDFVFSNLQHVNFISVIAQYFLKSRIIIFRHHFRFIESSDEKIAINKNEILFACT